MRFLALLLLALISGSAIANPIVLSNESHSIFLLEFLTVGVSTKKLLVALSVAISALYLEYLSLRRIFGEQKIEIRALGAGFVVINALTFPLTQLAALWLGFIAEVIPLAAESTYYHHRSGRSYRFKKIVLGVLLANAVSWAVGFLVVRQVYEW